MLLKRAPANRMIRGSVKNSWKIAIDKKPGGRYYKPVSLLPDTQSKYASTSV
jgi:hypothetical protein